MLGHSITLARWDDKGVLQGHGMREFSSPIFFLCLGMLLSCGKPPSDSAVEESMPSSGALESADISPGQELRWLIEGVAPAGSSVSAVFTVEGPASSSLDVYLLSASGEALLGASLPGGEGTAYEEVLDCGEAECAFSYAAKAIHAQGGESLVIVLEASAGQEQEGDIVISELR